MAQDVEAQQNGSSNACCAAVICFHFAFFFSVCGFLILKSFFEIFWILAVAEDALEAFG